MSRCPRSSMLLVPGVLVVLTMACGTLPKSKVELRSEPAGASVSTAKGELLGTTPLTLEDETLQKIRKGSQISVLLSSPGYRQRELLLTLQGDDTHEISLTPYEKDHFAAVLLEELPAAANEFARNLVEIQGLIFARNLPEASRKLEEFQKRYPNIAAGYVLGASIESLRKDQEKAKRYLLRARTLDPQDPVAVRMLNRIQPGGAP